MEQATFLPQVAEVTLSYRSKVKPSERPQIRSSRDAERIFRVAWSEDMELLEELVVLFLNKSNKVISFFRVSRGGHSGTVVDAKIIFSAALKALASGMVLAHNHPSGSLKPTSADIEQTRKLCEAGKVLDISVLDHLILTTDGYFSFADEGMM